jgi:hypothetical protein
MRLVYSARRSRANGADPGWTAKGPEWFVLPVDHTLVACGQMVVNGGEHLLRSKRMSIP